MVNNCNSAPGDRRVVTMLCANDTVDHVVEVKS